MPGGRRVVSGISQRVAFLRFSYACAQAGLTSDDRPSESTIEVLCRTFILLYDRKSGTRRLKVLVLLPYGSPALCDSIGTQRVELQVELRG